MVNALPPVAVENKALVLVATMDPVDVPSGRIKKYRIQVREDGETRWDSVFLASPSETLSGFISRLYAGAPFFKQALCDWRAMVWDHEEIASDWSNRKFFVSPAASFA